MEWIVLLLKEETSHREALSSSSRLNFFSIEQAQASISAPLLLNNMVAARRTQRKAARTMGSTFLIVILSLLSCMYLILFKVGTMMMSQMRRK